MNINDILLKKEEIPIFNDKYFFVPIYPPLLTTDIDPMIARRVFPQAAQEWQVDLQKAAEGAPQEKKEWYENVFLAPALKIEERNGSQIVIPPQGGWYDDVVTANNGFATVLSINRNHGMLMFIEDNRSLEYICRPSVNFTPEKFKAYAAPVEQLENLSGIQSYVYCRENIIGLPAALFLRNWAILYLNESLKSIEDKLG